MSDREDRDLDDTADTEAPDLTTESAAPLESDPADWQEQHTPVSDPDPDERR